VVEKAERRVTRVMSGSDIFSCVFKDCRHITASNGAISTLSG